MSMKSAYYEKLQGQFDEWNAEIKKMKAQADKANADAQIKYWKQIEELREQQVEAQKKMQDLLTASDDAWQDMKAGVESAWTDMQSAIEKATQRFK